MEDVSPLVVKIERPLYEQEQLHNEYGYEKPSKLSFQDYLKNCKNCSPSKIILRLIPAIQWLSRYDWRGDFSGDIIAGFTVAILNIPQGMAYGLMANVPAICGLYTSFFPVIVYFVLGTSRHNSMGTFAVVCLMTGKAVVKYSDPTYFADNLINSNSTGKILGENATGFSPIEVATMVTFLVGVFQILMFVLRLGILNVLLSETLVSGFTTAAAIQVFTSQIKDILGMNLKRHSGYFEIIFTYVNIFKNLNNINFLALVISIGSIILLLVNNELIKPKISKYCSFPIPMELILVIFGTLISKYLNLQSEYGIKVIGHVPKGVPTPTVPNFSLMNSLLIDSLMIAVVSYTLTLSMGLIFAQKLNYEVDANQELLAVGAGNIFGSFFSCIPNCASISRSLLQQTVGGKTQIASLTSCILIFFVLMWLGPLFESLPKAVLAGIIIVAVKRMVMNVRDFFKFLKMSKTDAAVWLCTFLSVVIVGVDIGLLTGISLSLGCILISSLKPFSCILGPLPHTDLYLDIARYKGVAEVAGLKIFHYCGGINFASKNIFKSDLFRIVGIDPQKELVARKKLEKYTNGDEDKPTIIETVSNFEKIRKLEKKITSGIHCLVLDFSAVSHVDSSGISTVKLIAQQYSKIGIITLLAGCSGPVYEKIKKFELLDCNSNANKDLTIIFPTIHDAVQFALQKPTTTITTTTTTNLEKTN